MIIVIRGKINEIPSCLGRYNKGLLREITFWINIAFSLTKKYAVSQPEITDDKFPHGLSWI